MLQPSQLSVGPYFSAGSVTASAGTAFSQIIPPYRGTNAPLVYKKTAGTSVPNWWGPSSAFTQISTLIYTAGATAHAVGIMRPFNFCYLTADAAAAQTTIYIDKNPGTYSTNYNYPLPPSQVPSTADNTMAANDYVAYQAADGTWRKDILATVSGLTVTLTTNIPTGGLAKGTPLFFFGLIADTDPTTGLANPTLTAPAAATTTYQDTVAGLWQGLHLGDPLIFYSPNGTNAGTMALLSAFYTKSP